MLSAHITKLQRTYRRETYDAQRKKSRVNRNSVSGFQKAFKLFFFFSRLVTACLFPHCFVLLVLSHSSSCSLFSSFAACTYAMCALFYIFSTRHAVDVYSVSYCVYIVDLYDVFRDTVSVVWCRPRLTHPLLRRHDIRTQDRRLSQQKPQKHSRDNGVRHEGSSFFFLSCRIN